MFTTVRAASGLTIVYHRKAASTIQESVQSGSPRPHWEMATGSIDFHSAMPENRGVAAVVTVAIAAAQNGIG